MWGRAIDISSNGTANSYIISNAGSYKFKTTKGNSSESVGTVASAEVLWETFGTDMRPDEMDLIVYVWYSDGYIYFNTADTYKKGNALIAAKDADGKTLWSWHIWMTDTPKDQVYYNNAGTMMDRNLGATSATPGDVEALGLLYQWGRKDPFIGSSSISGGLAAESTIVFPNNVTSDASKGSIEYATANPTTFITQNNKNFDWLYTGSEITDKTLWQSTKTIYDPCPVGYRVPDGNFTGIWQIAFGDSMNPYPAWDGNNYGFNLGGSLDTGTKYLTSEECWYPAAGYKDCITGSVDFVGVNGAYWSCTPDEYFFSAYYLFFVDMGDIIPANNYFRSYGMSVRCVRE